MDSDGTRRDVLDQYLCGSGCFHRVFWDGARFWAESPLCLLLLDVITSHGVMSSVFVVSPMVLVLILVLVPVLASCEPFFDYFLSFWN